MDAATSRKDKDDVTSGLCVACFGLCPREHEADGCPLVRAALETCDCDDGPACPLSDPRCSRRLLSLLLCLQLWDARMARKLPQEELSLESLAPLWQGRLEHLSLFVRVSSSGHPVPARWKPLSPLFAPCEGLLEGSARVRILQPIPAPVVVEQEVGMALVAESWAALLAGVTTGRFLFLHRGELVPFSCRSRTEPGRRPPPWRPVAYHPKRGFLVEKKPRRKWVALKDLSLQEIETLHAFLVASESDALDDESGDVLQRIALDDHTTMESLEAESERLVDTGVVEPLVEVDSEDERGEGEDSQLEEPAKFVAAAPDETATGGFREQLAQFAAQYAQNQLHEQQQQHQRATVSKEKPRREEVQPGIVWEKWKKEGKRRLERVCWCRGIFVLPLLLTAAVCMTVIAITLDIGEVAAAHGRLLFATLTPNTGLNFVLFTLWMFAMSAVPVFLALHVRPAIAGSGEPEIRAILTGATLPEYLRTSVLPAKWVGLLGMLCSGLWLGKEGPAIHLAALVTSALMRLPLFSAMRKNRTLWRHVISSSTGLGLAAAFSTPIGGVLYAVEATGSYFSVDELFMAFTAAIPAALTVRLIVSLFYSGRVSFSSIAGETPVTLLVPNAGEFFWTLLIAGVLGFLGPVFIELSSQIVKTRRRVFKSSPFFGRQLVYYGVVLLASSLLFFPAFIGPFMTASPLEVLIALTSGQTEPLEESGWFGFNFYGALVVFFVVKTVMMAFGVSLPGPVGLLIPSLAEGAAFGRLLGELLVLIQGSTAEGIGPGGFALVGAACFCASITHSLSVAVVVLELLGEWRLSVVVLLAAAVSHTTSRLLTSGVGIYERIAFDRNLPYLFTLSESLYPLRASGVMVAIDCAHPSQGRGMVLSANATLEDADALLAGAPDGLGVVPVVDSLRSQRLIGFVAISDLARYRRRRSSSQSVEPPPVHLMGVKVVVAEKTPFALIHQLFAQNKANIIPVCTLGKLVGLIYREDVVKMLIPKRYQEQTGKGLAKFFYRWKNTEDSDDEDSVSDSRNLSREFERTLVHL
jgi:H+/Cl- antiporter ClcA/CBS domain-containing protein